MARQGSAKYGLLGYPEPGKIRVPDATLLSSKKERRLIDDIAVVAWDNLSTVTRGTGGTDLSEALRMLELTLVGWMTLGREDDPPDSRAIVTGARLGYVIGIMENGSGVAHSNQSEAHYTAAMVVIRARLAEQLPPTVMSEFATECGYFLARTGDEALETIAKIVLKSAEKLRA